MNKSNNKTTFIIIAGIFILCVFAYVATINLLPNNSSNSFFIKNDNINASIDNVELVEGKLQITTSGESSDICVKATKSIPNNNAICWKELENNSVSISIFVGKEYFIWIRDYDGNISNYMIYNTNNKKKKNNE